MPRLNKASVIILTAFASVAVLSAAAFLSSPTGASAAWSCRTACTATNRGISSFSCPGTPTESVCGTSPNFTCYEGNNDTCPDNYKMYCEQANCPVACDRDNYPCGAPSGCTVATSNINGNCSNPANGMYTDRCGACACPSSTVQCTSPNKCVTPTGCPTGYTFDACLESCTTPNILISPTAPQAASISVTGDITTSGGKIVAQTGDLYLPSGKAIRIDAASNTLLNVGNGTDGWGAHDVNLNVLGSITATKSFGIGSVFSVNNAGNLSVYAGSGPIAILGYNNLGSGTGVQGQGTYTGVYGVGMGSGYGVLGSSSSIGVFGSGVTYGVYGTASVGPAVYGNTSTNYGGYFVSTGAGTGLYASSASGYAAIFNSGNVGIGTTTPGYKLHVGGNIFVSGAAGFGGASVGGGPTIAVVPLAAGGQGIYAQANIAGTTAIIGRANLDNNVGVEGFGAGTGSKGILGTAGVVGAYGGYFNNNYGGEALHVGSGSTVLAGSLSVGGDLSVPGGPAATITLGDSTSDSVIFNARPASSFNPQSHNLYDLGIDTLRWKDLYLAGTAKITGFQLSTGATAGYVLTANASGVGAWQANPATIGGSGTINYVTKFTAGTTIGNSMIYDNGTNVGIGTTAPHANVKVHIANGNLGFDAGYGIWTKDSAGSMIGILSMDGSTNQTTIRGYGGGWRVASKTGLQLMYIDDAGQTIIGSGSPTAKFDVAGTAKMTGFQLTTGAGAGKVLQSDASGNGTWVTAPVPSGSNYQMLRNNGTGWVTTSAIEADDTNVGIGLDPSFFGVNAQKVTVWETTANKDGMRVFSDTGDGIFAQSTSGDALTTHSIYGIGAYIRQGNPLTQNSTMPTLYVSRGYSPLNGYDATAPVVRVSDSTLATGDMMMVEKMVGASMTDFFRIRSNGNVGIGTASPGTKLEVNGTAKMTGFQLGSSATSGYVLTANSSGVGTWQANPTYIGGSGTSYAIPRFTAGTTLGDSMMRQDSYGTGIGIGGTDSVNPIWGELDIFRSGSYSRLYLSSSQSAAGNIPGVITFAAKNASALKKDYSGISGYISDATNGSEDGDIRFHTVLNGTWNVRAWLTSEGRFALGGYNPTGEMLFVPGNVQVGANDSTTKYLAFGYAPLSGKTLTGSSRPADIRWDPAGGAVSIYTDNNVRLVGATAAPTSKFTITSAGDVQTGSSTRMTGSTLYANTSNTAGGGVWISDDGGLYDYNDGWIRFVGSNGIDMQGHGIWNANFYPGGQTSNYWGWDGSGITKYGANYTYISNGTFYVQGTTVLRGTVIDDDGGSLEIGTNTHFSGNISVGSSTGANPSYAIYGESYSNYGGWFKNAYYGSYTCVGCITWGIGAYGSSTGGYFKSLLSGYWTYLDYSSYNYGMYTNGYEVSLGHIGYSDARTKRDIHPFTDSLGVLRQLDPVNFTYNGLANSTEGAKGIGLIAQDVKDLAPYLISTFKTKLHPDDSVESDIYMLESGPLTYITINSVKELDKIVTEQRGTIQELQERVSRLEEAIGKLGGN